MVKHLKNNKTTISSLYSKSNIIRVRDVGDEKNIQAREELLGDLLNSNIVELLQEQITRWRETGKSFNEGVLFVQHASSSVAKNLYKEMYSEELKDDSIAMMFMDNDLAYILLSDIAPKTKLYLEKGDGIDPNALKIILLAYEGITFRQFSVEKVLELGKNG